MMKKMFVFMLSMIGALTIFAGAASAHVTVQPSETTQGKYEVFTVKVPSENETVPTTKIEVKIPDDVDVTRFEPKPGWKYELQKDASGKITSVTWTTEDNGLAPTEFAMFNMTGKVGDKAEKIVWKAYQTYKDGSVVEWVGAEDAEKPASVTVVHPASASETGNGTEAVQTDQTADTTANDDEASSSNTSLYVSIAALLAALIALGVSLKKK